MSKVYILPDPSRSWMVTVRFPFDAKIVAWMKQIPGAKWEPKAAIWYFPVEMVPALIVACKEAGLSVFHQKPLGTPSETPLPGSVGSLLHPYQAEAVRRAINASAWLFNDEMGLGKSAEAIAAMRALGVDEAVIVCPAQARLAWFNPKHLDPLDPISGQLTRWWPNHPQVALWQPGKDEPHGTLHVVSYEMLDKVLELEVLGWPQALVFDEIHYLQNPRTARSGAARKLTEAFPRAWRCGLTGTPITNGPDTISNPLNLLYPGRFESGFRFAQRYSQGNHNGYGWEFSGVNEANAGELRDRLSLISSRTTQSEVASLLPPFIVNCQFIDPKRRHQAGVEFVESALGEGSTHLCLLTHHKDLASALVLALDKEHSGVEVFKIDGEVSAEDRMEIISKARNAKKSIIVATLHSVNVAIDLTFCSVVAFVESYGRPVDMLQVLGRFSRLSGKNSVRVTLFSSEAGDDPAEKVAVKIVEIAKILKAGRTEAGMAGVAEELKSAGYSKDDVDALLAIAAASYVES